LNPPKIKESVGISITYAELEVLMSLRLDSETGLTSVRLAVQKDASVLTCLLDMLCDKKLIKVGVDKKDRRRKSIFLTLEGVKFRRL